MLTKKKQDQEITKMLGSLPNAWDHDVGYTYRLILMINDIMPLCAVSGPDIEAQELTYGEVTFQVQSKLVRGLIRPEVHKFWTLISQPETLPEKKHQWPYWH